MGRSVVRPSVCTFNDFRGDAGDAGLKTMLWELLLHTYTKAFLTSFLTSFLISFRRIMLKVID